MTSLTIELPDTLQEFVCGQVAEHNVDAALRFVQSVHKQFHFLCQSQETVLRILRLMHGSIDYSVLFES